jgi:chlorite dismutase
MLSRQQLAGAPVFVIVASFKLRPSWANAANELRTDAAEELRRVLAESPRRVDAGIYLSRGLKASADYFIRVHANDLEEAQAYIQECQETAVGRHSQITDAMLGTTKPRHYITSGNSAELNDQLNSMRYEAAEPKYAIVIPVKKNAHWWNMSAHERLQEIEVHTQKSLAYMKTVKRELYHSTGLDEMDFITYFETADLYAFHELVTALASIREHEFEVRSGHAMLVGSILTIPKVVARLCALPGQ